MREGKRNFRRSPDACQRRARSRGLSRIGRHSARHPGPTALALQRAKTLAELWPGTQLARVHTTPAPFRALLTLLPPRRSVPPMRALLFMLPLAALAACTEPNPYLGVCGNGVVEPDHGEACDDGEANADDAPCTLACQRPRCGDALLQPGEACDLGDQNAPDSVCTPACQVARCGDGFHQEGVEECDEGAFNKAVHDGKGGCSTECRVLPRCGNYVDADD